MADTTAPETPPEPPPSAIPAGADVAPAADAPEPAELESARTGVGGFWAAAIFGLGAICMAVAGAPILAAVLAVVAITCVVAAVLTGGANNPILAAGSAATNLALALSYALRGEFARAWMRLKAIRPFDWASLIVLIILATLAYRWWRKRRK